MSEQLSKLRPDRDLQCYFRRPSAVAALSDARGPASGNAGFTLSGSWCEALDWAVVEWNRDNVFEHPALRNLPDGNLSGVRLSYEETRTNCVPMDSTLQWMVEWPFLRIWATDASGTEAVYFVPLRERATPLGDYTPAKCRFTLEGTCTQDDYIELAWLDQHYNFQMWGQDNIPHALGMLADAITAGQASGFVTAVAEGNQIELTYLGLPGTNGNRIGVYGTVHGARTESWTGPDGNSWAMFAGGVSPDRWRVDLDFGSLQGYKYPDLVHLTNVPANNVRKMRWTWAADRQVGEFARGEFAVAVSNWSVTGSGLAYQVAGPGSRRIEDDDTGVLRYSGVWTEGRGNFSGGSIRWATAPGASVECSYTAATAHRLYLGTRRADACAKVVATVDGQALPEVDLKLGAEDVLVRLPLGDRAAGTHTVRVTHAGAPGTYLYFDFLETAVPSADLPDFAADSRTTLATDWDTDHSLALAPERTAWLIQKLGCRGRQNHYAGALWFYELCRPGHQYASATIAFAGDPVFGVTTNLWLGQTRIDHMSLIGDTVETVVKAFELLINAGTNAVWARAEGGTLMITARAMGADGNGLAIEVQTNAEQFTATSSAAALTGGGDRTVSAGRSQWLGPAACWVTDTGAVPRINRAVRDWSRSFFRALAGYGIPVTAAFSMELQHGDDEAAAGLAQRYPDGAAAWLNTPRCRRISARGARRSGGRSSRRWRRRWRKRAWCRTCNSAKPSGGTSRMRPACHSTMRKRWRRSRPHTGVRWR